MTGRRQELEQKPGSKGGGNKGSASEHSAAGNRAVLCCTGTQRCW